jgi:hypothetical protein
MNQQSEIKIIQYGFSTSSLQRSAAFCDKVEACLVQKGLFRIAGTPARRLETK